MNDREKTIQGLQYTIEMCLFDPATGYSKGPDDLNELTRITYDACFSAIALLKEQEPVKAVADGEDSYICNNCGTVIGWDALEPGGVEEVKYKFCPECGRPLKWE